MSNIKLNKDTLEFSFIEITETLIKFKYTIFFIFVLSIFPLLYERENRTKSYYGEIVFLNNYPEKNSYISDLTSYKINDLYFPNFEKNILFTTDDEVKMLIQKNKSELPELSQIPYEFFKNVSYESMHERFQTSDRQQLIKIDLILPSIISEEKVVLEYLSNLIQHSHLKSVADIKRQFEFLLDQKKKLMAIRLNEVKSFYLSVKKSLNENLTIARNMGINDPLDNITLSPNAYIDPLSSNNFILGTKYIEQRIDDINQKIETMNIEEILTDPILLRAKDGMNRFDLTFKTELEHIEIFLKSLDTIDDIQKIVKIESQRTNIITQAMPAYPFLIPIFIPLLSIFIILFYAYYRKLA